MPATRLVNAIFIASMFDVVGQDGATPFVLHLGLCASSGSGKRTAVAVHDMGPPLNSPGKMNVDVVGTADLDDSERQKLKSFLDRHAGEHSSQKISKRHAYIVYPHAEENVEQDGTYTHTRFSCAGFTIEAYRFARINLINLQQVPPASLKLASDAYPHLAQFLHSEKVRAEYGLAGEGPWPILFCGYVMHAMSRSAAEIRAKRLRTYPGRR